MFWMFSNITDLYWWDPSNNSPSAQLRQRNVFWVLNGYRLETTGLDQSLFTLEQGFAQWEGGGAVE